MSNLLGLNEVSDFIMGQAPHSSTYNESGEGQLLIKVGDFGKLYPKPKTYTTAPISFSQLGDVIICVVGATSGKVNLGINASITRSVAALRPKDKTDMKYLYYSLKGSYIKLNRAATGSAQGILNKTSLSNFKIPLPPLDQQKKIAAILDAADAYKQKSKALIEKYDELTQSLFMDMFGNVKDNSHNFNIVSLNEICSKITDGEHGTVKRLNTGKLYLMARNIRDSYIDLKDVSYISDEDHQRIYKRCGAEEGDLLLVCVGATIGRMCITPEMEDFSLARSVALLKPKKEIINSFFLYSVLNSNYLQEVIKRSGNSSAQAGLYTGKIKKLEIFLPPFSLQNQFADRVKAIEIQKAQAQASLVQAEDLFNSLLQKAFKGELVE